MQVYVDSHIMTKHKVTSLLYFRMKMSRPTVKYFKVVQDVLYNFENIRTFTPFLVGLLFRSFLFVLYPRKIVIGRKFTTDLSIKQFLLLSDPY